ncbi:MAG TPA: hypothetical protein VF294_05625, partial [Polyangiaceae bacterium]
PVVAPPATPVPVPVAPPAGMLGAPALGVGWEAVPLDDEPLTPAPPPAGTELPKLGSSSGVNVEVRPPQPAIATKHKPPNQTRAPENATAITGI